MWQPTSATGGFDGRIVFVNDLQEYVVPATTLAKYARLVSRLRQTGKPLFGLFGGYFTLLLRKVGLGSFSTAVGYGEYRDSSYHVGGQAVRRYYLPRLHRYFSDTEAESLLAVINDQSFRCTCSVCRRARRLTNFTPQELLDHFLNVRGSEIETAATADLGNLLREIDETRRIIERRPAIPFDRYSHLRSWAEALQSFV